MNSVSQMQPKSNRESISSQPALPLVETLLQQLREAMISDPALLQALEVASGKQTLNAKEGALAHVHQTLNSVVNAVCLSQEKGYQGSKTTCPCCGGTARFVRHEGKQMVTLAGAMDLSRSLYECRNSICGYRWRPLDEALCLPAGRYSESVRRVISLVGANLPFERATEVLWDVARLSVSATQVRSITEQVGADIEAIIQEETQQHHTGSLRSLPPPEILVMGTDGAHLNTREGSWKETKVGSVRRYRRVDETTIQLEGSTFTAHLGNVDDFRPKLDTEIARQGSQGQEATIFLGDGARWIWNMASEIVPDAVHVLDYFHLCEHVWGAAKALFGDTSPEGQTWARTITEDLLRVGKVSEALAKIAATLPSDSVPRKEALEQRRGLIQYITNNQEHMSYPWLEERGYPIGSGHVESACKQIVSQRHKQAGMRWSKEGAQKMLSLAAFYHGSRWEEYWLPRVS